MESQDHTKAEHKSSRAIKGAPLGSLFAQFCLHSLWFGNCNIRGTYDYRNAVGGGILLAVQLVVDDLQDILLKL